MGQRSRGKELTPQLRSRICELRSIGWSYGQIGKRYPEIPVQTIKSTIRNEANRVDNTSRPRSGRPRQLSEEQREHLYQLKQSNPEMTIKDLIAAVGGVVKKRSIQRALQEMELRKGKNQSQSVEANGNDAVEPTVEATLTPAVDLTAEPIVEPTALTDEVQHLGDS